MTVPQLSLSRPIFGSPPNDRFERFDSDTGCTVVVSTPSTDPGLWADFLEGAGRSYHKHGIEIALDVGSLADEANTQLFHAVVNSAGEIVAGIRAKGPLESPEESHAVVEWAGQPGLSTVYKMLSDRLPFGVIEMKTAWMTDDPNRSRSLATTLARTPFTTMALLDAQFVMATASSHVLNRWRSSGGVVATKVPATPYPDDRYRTKMMWWDRSTFTNHADSAQVSKIFNEMSQLNEALKHRVGVPALNGSSG